MSDRLVEPRRLIRIIVNVQGALIAVETGEPVERVACALRGVLDDGAGASPDHTPTLRPAPPAADEDSLRLGLEQVDEHVIDAARGMGLSRRQVLTRIELPLAVPVILAGVRTTLVIVVGTAALGTFINGGGLGDFINNGIKLRSDAVTYTGAVLTAVLALGVDWLGGIAEEYLRPRGL